MGLRIFLRDWNDFAAKAKFGIVVEYFCGIGIGLRMFLSEEKREEKLDLEKFCLKRRMRERKLDVT